MNLPTGPIRALITRAGDLPVGGERLSDTAQTAATRALEELMQTPARHVVLELLFRELARRVAARSGDGVAASVRCRVVGGQSDDAAVYELHVGDSDCRVVRGATDRAPALTVTLEDRELIRLALGRSSPARAILGGKLKLSGDVPALAALLRPPGPPVTGRSRR